MIVFGPEDHGETGGSRIFRASPSPPAPPALRPDALARLLVAAEEAERSHHELGAAKARYQEAPTRDNLQRLLDAAALALEKECAFDEFWDEVSARWFGEAPPVV